MTIMHMPIEEAMHVHNYGIMHACSLLSQWNKVPLIPSSAQQYRHIVMIL